MSFIERVHRTSDETPPWEGMVFMLPVESDILSEELRRAYPDCKTLRERKHLAAIDFLKAELNHMRSGRSSSAVTEDNYLVTPGAPSPYSDAVEDRSRRESPSSSYPPGSVALRPASAKQKVQQASTRGPQILTTPLSPSTSNAAHQFVFSAVDGRLLQPKSKRPMTKKEKVEYKETRKRGACLPCRRQKAKCTHIVDGLMDSVSSTRKSRVVKRKFDIDLSTDRHQERKRNKPEDRQHSSPPDTTTSSRPSRPLPDMINMPRSFSDPSIRMEMLTNDSRRDGMGGEEQSDVSRYVNNSGESYGIPLHGGSEPPWSDLHATMGMEPFSPGYHQLHMPSGLILPSPSENIASLISSNQSDFLDYIHSQWTEPQEVQLDLMEPG
ncbi:hypothetical protein CC86DRAFT_149036 [Ophiobolus disseminans]|uniref:Uncharacterized protein n=1 Tax=Ophiobolus disseminans TaxID=1469910 RepID=A0A6A6ZED9_9PLEO|nr:hypothetical protein CC86DRAFT_149036 [Ophiobolus disseminans]